MEKVELAANAYKLYATQAYKGHPEHRIPSFHELSQQAKDGWQHAVQYILESKGSINGP